MIASMPAVVMMLCVQCKRGCCFHVCQVQLLHVARVSGDHSILCWPLCASSSKPLPYILCPGQAQHSPCTTRVCVRHNIHVVSHVSGSDMTFTLYNACLGSDITFTLYHTCLCQTQHSPCATRVRVRHNIHLCHSCLGQTQHSPCTTRVCVRHNIHLYHACLYQT